MNKSMLALLFLACCGVANATYLLDSFKLVKIQDFQLEDDLKAYGTETYQLYKDPQKDLCKIVIEKTVGFKRTACDSYEAQTDQKTYYFTCSQKGVTQ